MTKNAVTPADDELETIETEADVEAEAEEMTFSPKDLAAELGTDAKSFRRWLRNFTPERAADTDGRWKFTAARKAELIAAYNADETDADESDEESDDSEATDAE